MGKLVHYVVTMPSDEDSEARKYKYPYVAGEVLSCDTAAVREALFGSPALIRQLLELLKQPPPVPPVLAGYVCKIITSLQKATDGPEAFKRFFEDADGIAVDDLLPQIITHVGSDSFLQMLIALCIGARSSSALPACGDRALWSRVPRWFLPCSLLPARVGARNEPCRHRLPAAAALECCTMHHAPARRPRARAPILACLWPRDTASRAHPVSGDRVQTDPSIVRCFSRQVSRLRRSPAAQRPSRRRVRISQPPRGCRTRR